MAPSERAPQPPRDMIFLPQPEDLPALTQFLLAAAAQQLVLAGIEPVTTSQYMTELREQDHDEFVAKSIREAKHCCVAKDYNGQITGMINVLNKGSVDQIETLWVLPSRADSYLRELLLEQYFYSSDYSTDSPVLVEVIDTDFATQNFYRGYGFKRVSWIQTDDPWRTIVMRLDANVKPKGRAV